MLRSKKMEAEAQQLDRVECPSCGGAGGGPFGRAGSAWDDEDFVCPRCKGAGVIAFDDLLASPSPSPSQRPGIVKAVPDVVTPSTEKKKRKASA
jgi:hypothetical protein